MKKEIDVIWINAARIALERGMNKEAFAEKLNKRVTTLNNWVNGSKPVGKASMKLMAKVLNVSEDVLLKPVASPVEAPPETPQQPTLSPDINQLIKIIEEQNKRIEEQGKSINGLNDLMFSQKDLISAQGERITDQGKRIDLVTNIACKAQTDSDFLRDRVASIQDTVNKNNSSLGKIGENLTTIIKNMNEAADTGDIKKLEIRSA